MNVGFFKTNLFLVKLESKFLKFFSIFSWVIIIIEAFLFILFGFWIRFYIEILFFAKILVIDDKTPGTSFASILK